MLQEKETVLVLLILNTELVFLTVLLVTNPQNETSCTVCYGAGYLWILIPDWPKDGQLLAQLILAILKYL
jgi:hypothetical protein